MSCKKTPLHVDSGTALALYEPPVPRLVGAMKFRGFDTLASRAALEMARFARTSSLASALDTTDAVTWIPSTRARNRKRGFDPAELLAAGLARRFRLPVLALLDRTRAVAPQSTLPAARRRVNMNGVFSARRGARDLSLLLVDDVVTTGATVAAAAGALRDAGVHRIHLFAFARTPEPEVQ
ncbi:MAG TPA: phosphoribosyltransferase family protein [Thermoanaerobaculia bacterium]|nr:phosphoribosyltransferase family protein [Thermoanaerobaculia bacterium]